MALAAAAIAAATLPATPASAVTPGAPLQDIAQLQNLAQSAATRHLPPLSDRQRLIVGPVAPQLQLDRCTAPVQPLVSPGPHMQDRITVELRCEGTPSWHLYVPVRVVATSPVVVAAHAIIVGVVLTAADLRVEQHDVSGVPAGYLDDPSIAVGLTAVRPIAGGAILTNQELTGAKAVQRGQAVTLVSDAGGIGVRMAGRALNDGLINQRVRVQNLSSGKIVEGIARSEQVVEIISQ